MLNFYLLLPSLVDHHFFLLVERSFLEINAKGGEILGENVREERLICGFKGIKERHIRFFNFMAWCVQGKFKLMLLIRIIYASV